MSEKVSALMPATTINSGDYLLLVQSGMSMKVDIATLLKNMPVRFSVLEASENLTAPGAIATNLLTSKISSSGSFTLAAGTHGMEKEIVCTGAFSAVVTVTSGAGFTTITFSGNGNSVKLKNIDGIWYIINSNSVVIA